jgi:ribosomal protein S18 acetylase RimI-like enzyme
MASALSAAVDREAIVAAIEDNLFGLAPLLGLLPGAEQGAGEEGLWTVSAVDFPFFNSTFRSRLEPERVDAALDRMLARAREKRVPLLWWTGPQTRPRDLGRALVARGFVRDADAPGMALALAALGETPVGPPGLEVERVSDSAALATWVQTFRAGFGIDPEFEQPWIDWLAAVGLDRGAPLSHFVARRDGEPVGTASILLAAGVAGVYNVTTLPAARRRGVGAETTRAALAATRAETDLAWAVLHSSEMGLRIYRALGFREYCRIGIYFWMG